MLQQRVERQETEVVAKAKRRTFTAKYKRKIVREADGCTEPGEIGALLRREGLYSSHLTVWRRELAAGELSALAPKKRGPKGKQVDPQAQELAMVRRQLDVATARAERAELLVEIQKKLSLILGLDLPKLDEDQ
jgi:transposase-like protein